MPRIISDAKFARLCQTLRDRKVDVVWIDDNERSRDVNLNYLTGHPNDATVLVYADGQVALRPWDLPLAGKMAHVTRILGSETVSFASPQPLYDDIRQKLGESFTIEFTTRKSHYAVGLIQDAFPKARIISTPQGAEKALQQARAAKEPGEIEKMRAAAGLTNSLLARLPDFIRSEGNKLREVDVALFLETEMRRAGATGTSFETIVANKNRSFGIHAFPAASTELLCVSGPAILDFGVKLDGYCSDVTVPLMFGTPTAHQQAMLDAVRAAYDAAIAVIKPGIAAHVVAETAVNVLKERGGFTMPHGLGHGVGLEVHDPVTVAPKPTDPGVLKNWTETILEPGMIFTVEPGTYDPAHGGVRLENDVLVTSSGVEVLTRSAPLAFPQIVA